MIPSRADNPSFPAQRFQYPKVRLIRVACELILSVPPIISIPEGAIDTGLVALFQAEQRSVFQYPKVRLILIFHQLIAGFPKVFQYPKVRLIHNLLYTRNDAGKLFQYPKVRLIPCRFPENQQTQTDISIPEGAIDTPIISLRDLATMVNFNTRRCD